MKIGAHKRLSRGLGTIISRKLGTRRLAIKLEGTLLRGQLVSVNLSKERLWWLPSTVYSKFIMVICAIYVS